MKIVLTIVHVTCSFQDLMKNGGSYHDPAS